jgi:hypothetical protein
MNSTNIKVQAAKSQTAQPVSALLILDSQMAACNYGVDHPWRLALADAIAESEDSTRLPGLASDPEPIRKQAYEVESAQFIRAANEQILKLTSGGVQ